MTGIEETRPTEGWFEWRTAVVPLLSAIVGGVLATCGSILIQARELTAEKDRSLIQLQLEQTEGVVQTLLSVGPLADRPFVRAAAYHDAVWEGGHDSTLIRLRNEYDAARQQWKEEYSRLMLILGIYFGADGEEGLRRIEEFMAGTDTIVRVAAKDRSEYLESRDELRRLRGRSEPVAGEARQAFQAHIASGSGYSSGPVVHPVPIGEKPAAPGAHSVRASLASASRASLT